MTPVVAKATRLANSANEVCAPCDNPTAELWPEIDGVTSKVAVKVPLCDGKAVLTHVPLAGVGGEQLLVTGFTVRFTIALWLRLPLEPVMVMVYVPGVAVDALSVELPEPVTDAGFKFNVTPAGELAALKETAPVKPLS